MEEDRESNVGVGGKDGEDRTPDDDAVPLVPTCR